MNARTPAVALLVGLLLWMALARCTPVDEVEVVTVAALDDRVLGWTPTAPATTSTTTTSAPPTTTTTARPALTATPRVAPSGDVWHRLAMCETGGQMDNPNTGNGYFGYLQFDLPTWRSVGGVGYPHEHSYAEQVEKGQRLHASRGWAPWPRCSRLLGLR